VYDGRLAALKARRRKAKTPSNRFISPHIRSRVFELIRREQWSPEQVSGWFMKQEGLSLSKFSIYNRIAAIFPYRKDTNPKPFSLTTGLHLPTDRLGDGHERR
jgi:IS30 family transposase